MGEDGPAPHDLSLSNYRQAYIVSIEKRDLDADTLLGTYTPTYNILNNVEKVVYTNALSTVIKTFTYTYNLSSQIIEINEEY